MKQIQTRSEFIGAFKGFRPKLFSTEGLEVLYTYLEALENDTGMEIEFNVPRLCETYNEATFYEIASNYQFDIDHTQPEEQIKLEVIDYLKDLGNYIAETSESIVYVQY